MAVESVLTEMDTATDKVRQLLRDYPASRNNDVYLTCLFWRYCDGLPIWFPPEYLWGKDALTPPSTIGRARRKLQELARVGEEPEWVLPDDEAEQRKREREEGSRRWATR